MIERVGQGGSLLDTVLRFENLLSCCAFDGPNEALNGLRYAQRVAFFGAWARAK